MKKILIVVGALFVIGMTTSCIRDFTCDCTLSNGTGTRSLEGYRKPDAKDQCDATETEYQKRDRDASCTLTAQ